METTTTVTFQATPEEAARLGEFFAAEGMDALAAQLAVSLWGEFASEEAIRLAAVKR